MEKYRSGHNGPDSKSGKPANNRSVGSNPTFSAIRLSPTAGKAFFHSLRRSSPKFSRHVPKSLFYKGFGAHPQYLFHCLCRGELGPGVQVGVDVGGRAEIAVPQPLLNLLHGNAVFQQQAGAAVPLRYNYDKPEKPRRIKGFEVFSLVFSSFSKPKNHTEISRIIGGVSLTTNE